MDSFANLKWSSNSNSNTSSRNSSKPGTPVQSGYDSFSNLTTIGKKGKKLESLSLAERQNMIKGGNGLNINSVSGGDTWSGLDLLGGTAGASVIVNSNTNETKITSNSLLDGLDVPVKGDNSNNGNVSSSSSTSANDDNNGRAEASTTASDNIDDLFAVFNKPKVNLEEESPQIKSQSPSLPQQHEPQPHRPIRLEDNYDDVNNDRTDNVEYNNNQNNPNDYNDYNDDYNDYDDYSADSKVFKNKSSSNNDKSDNHIPRRVPHHIPTPDPRDHAIAELMDMGFTDEQAIYALSNTSTGLDVRQAVDFLMSEAHERATGEKPQHKQRRNQRQDIPIDDIGKLATEFSTQFISKAGSLWSIGKKNIAKAIEQYNAPVDDSTPAWMRDAPKYGGDTIPSIHLESDSDISIKGRRSRREFTDSDMDTPPPGDDRILPEVAKPGRSVRGDTPGMTSQTDEALMLESGSRDRIRRGTPRGTPHATPHGTPRDTPPSSLRKEYGQPVQPQTSKQQPQPQPQPTLSRAQLLRERQKELKEDDTMYVSSSRRRQSPKISTPNISQSSSRTSTPNPNPPSRIITPKPTSKPIPKRQLITITSTALTMATSSREQGTDAFKRGDFDEAISHYSKALESIPPNHLLQTIILTNRSTCYIKCGDAKSALADAEKSITIIGPGLGAGEEVEPNKPLKDIWSKAVARRAEAFEYLEKFQDALESWSLLITNGYSSKQSMDGKRRCQDALRPKSATTPKVTTKQTPSSTPRQSTPTILSATGKAAVQKIKDSYESGEKFESEKFALHDGVNTKIENWRHGKEENLRALLASLDNILWAESGWKKVSLADLVIPKKVKIIYMKAAAKTHPDKISKDATTEQKMIAEAVFITLNKAWDQFKSANGMS